MNARFINTQLIIKVLAAARASLLAVVLATGVAPAFASEQPSSTAEKSLSIDSLAGLYLTRIEKLELELRTETERRTTILDQLDVVINELKALEKESDDVVASSPELTDNVQQINRDIEAVDRDIRHNKDLLTQVRTSLEKQPRLSVWQAALGKPEFKARHKLLATQRYLVHATQQKQIQLQTKRTLLSKRYQSIVEYSQNISDSIGELQNNATKVLDRRTQLELQLVEISSEIVARQDRVSKLIQRSESIKSDPTSQHFDKLQKKLRDPVEGRLIKKFAEPKAKGLLKWKGILVEAPLGMPFTAVSDGLVVFADQIQGLGNVAIVDHGQGYMTLYGMAELLLVQKDQLLLSGDPIGTVGEYVGADTSALYFEVRHNADAVDPQDWLEMHLITEKNKL